MHTTASDGRATTAEIARAAARAGVEVVVLTDHDQLSPQPGWHGRTLVLSGLELTPRRNHILALGLDQAPPPRWGAIPGEEHNGEPAINLKTIARAGGWSALAHPLDPPLAGSPEPRSFAATDFSAIDSDGLELLNAISAFKRGARGMLSGLRLMLMPRTYLPGPHPTLLALWDAVGRSRRWVAIGGADAHAFPSGRRWLPVAVYSYRRHMRLVTTGLWLSRQLTGRLAEDQTLVLNALRRGHCFVALGPARGFVCRLHGPGGESWLPGSEIPWRPGLRLEVRLPARGIIRLLCNGRLEYRMRARRVELEIPQAGLWRVEARRRRPPAGYRPWIYCNPFYLRREGTAGEA